MTNHVTRRSFLQSSALAGFGLPLLRTNAFASENDKLHIGCVGVGGKGWSDMTETAKSPHVTVQAICDIDDSVNHLGRAATQFPKATRYADWRVLLDKEKLDALIVSTPDHMHYPATMAAMERGKHVYTQKPLTHKLAEARHLAKVAAEKKLTTQMGIQNQSREAYRLTRHYIKEGILGKISKIYVWSFKNWGYDGSPYTEKSSIPESLDWNLWLGAAPVRPFVNKVYHPGQWRKILDFGCGTLGDMGIHIFDTPFKSLDLSEPLWVEAECRPPNGFGHAEQNKVHYGFASTKYTTDNFTFTWWDGEGAPRHNGNPDLQLPSGDRLPKQGALFVGEAGRMVLPHCSMPTFYPDSVLKNVAKPDIRGVDHYTQFLDAIDGKDKTLAGFDYAGPLAEALCLGVVACQFPGKRLKWNSREMQVTNRPEANLLLEGKYRQF